MFHRDIHFQTHYSPNNGQGSCQHHLDPQRRGLRALGLKVLPLEIFMRQPKASIHALNQHSFLGK